MPKFMVLYSSDASAQELMAQATPEQMKSSMKDWTEWKDALDNSIKFEWGLPLQADCELTPDGVGESHSQVSGYATMEADSKDKVIEALKNHPHLQRSGASIDVLEMISMPGM